MNESFVIDTFAWVEYFLGSERGKRVKNFIESNLSSKNPLAIEIKKNHILFGEVSKIISIFIEHERG